jgi:hypothetical protein
MNPIRIVRSFVVAFRSAIVAFRSAKVASETTIPSQKSTLIFRATANGLDFHRAPVVIALGFVFAIPNLVVSQTVGQQPFRSSELRPSQAQSIQAQRVPASARPGVASAGAIASDPNADPRIQARDQRFQQFETAVFSRAPSAIIQAWSKLEKPALIPVAEPIAEPVEFAPAPPAASLYNDARFQRFVSELQNDFVLGKWDVIGGKVKLLPLEHQEKLVKRLMAAFLQDTPADELTQLRMQQQRRGVDQRAVEQQYSNFDDILQLAACFPKRPLSDEILMQIGQVLSGVMRRGNTREELLVRLDAEVASTDVNRLVDQRSVAKLLLYAQQLDAMEKYLPNLENAINDKDFEALNLLSSCFLAAYAKENKSAWLEKAWTAIQAILGTAELSDKQSVIAIASAVELATKVRKELGQAWLDESFTSAPDRGVKILGAIGRRTATSLLESGHDSDSRLRLLKLQNDSVMALLSSNSDRAREWASVLELLALNWLRESEITHTDDQSTSLGPRMRRDMYGNMFYYQDNEGREYPYQAGQIKPITTSQLLEVRPNDQWLALIDPSLQPKFNASLARLYLKVSEESLAFPFVERLGKAHPKLAKDLVDEFIRVWTKNHDPNSDRNRSDYYMYMYGFESRAESIPLTRSKQQRNLQELSELVPKLRALNAGELDQQLLATAFMTCHSFAEVFKIQDLEQVFGPINEIPPKVIANLAQQMRTNLASVWKEVETQKTAKTKRNKKEVEAEVLRGYEGARSLLEACSVAHPEDPSLLVLRAALMHDENNYQSELKARSEFTANRRAAFDVFRSAAEAYARKLPSLEISEYDTEVYERWFYAALGACDLNLVDEKMISDPSQFSLIADSIRSLPPEQSDWHLSRIANLLFNRMSNAKPSVKVRYLHGGFAIVGDHPQARQAKQVFDYYNDLVTEIQLETVVDGSSNVGQETFGVFVNLNHTREIERESGGFGKYLQNQNNNNMFYYNYGRPTENYRDKFEEFIRELMKEHFEVMSVTFQVPEVKSRPTAKAGWRSTPYAYILLKARGPQVDKVPPLKLDLDFLDTSGYAILPIESPALAIDCSVAKPDDRPLGDLQITQILDERRAEEGTLVIEVKAVANGLVPSLPVVFGELKFNEFDVTSVDDNGITVSRFNAESNENVVTSERSWLVNLSAKRGMEKRPSRFEFASPLLETKEVVYQRYVDADLKTVSADVNLEEKYGKARLPWLIWTIGLAGIIGVILIVSLVVATVRRKRTVGAGNQLPDNMTPFQAIVLLQNLLRDNKLDEPSRRELEQSIAELHASYFDNSDAVDSPNLRSITEKWLSHAS